MRPMKLWALGLLAGAFSFNAFSTVTDDVFYTSINKVENTYREDFKQMGFDLNIDGELEDPTVNLYSTRIANHTLIKIFGGMGKAKAMTGDGLIMALCHEVGHTFADGPKVIGGWSATESEADYFAARKCFQRVVQGENHAEINSNQEVPELLDLKCYKAFKENEEARSLCIRTGMAGISLANVLASLADKVIDISTPDKTIVSKTLTFHATPQCRLDTYIAGALFQAKPLCWFHP